jgi:dihydrolipoamide dehydrogenase
MGQIGGPGMDAEIAKASQKFLTKQGLKFKLNTKVTAGEVQDAGVTVHVEAAKGGKEETVSSNH